MISSSSIGFVAANSDNLTESEGVDVEGFGGTAGCGSKLGFIPALTLVSGREAPTGAIGIAAAAAAKADAGGVTAPVVGVSGIGTPFCTSDPTELAGIATAAVNAFVDGIDGDDDDDDDVGGGRGGDIINGGIAVVVVVDEVDDTGAATEVNG